MNNTYDSHAKVHEFLKKHPMGVLSTVDSNGMPWGAAVYYIADEDFSIYFVTRTGSKKYDDLEKHSNVAFTVADSESQVTVQLSGTVAKMPVQKYMDVFFDKFLAIRPEGNHNWAPPVDKVHKGNYMPLQITPTKMTYSDYGEGRIEVKGDYSEQIIPAN